MYYNIKLIFIPNPNFKSPKYIKINYMKNFILRTKQIFSITYFIII